MTGHVSDIKRMSVHDGPGIRTTVFLKGCPLRCLWCHNPENLKSSPVLSHTEKLCVGCRACAEVCPAGVHEFVKASAAVDVVSSESEASPESIVHRIDRTKCTACGRCVAECYAGALKLYGREEEVSSVAGAVLSDRAFYEQSGGGVTFSGGEPLLQPTFLSELMRLLKTEGIHLAVDTCGEVPWTAFEAVLPYTDLFLFDVKHIDSEVHRKYTGTGNERILENLKKLSETGAPVEIRTPVIPGVNDAPETLKAIADMLSGMENVTCWRLLPYHSMGRAKYEAIGLPYEMPETELPDNERMRALQEALKPRFPRVMLSSDLA